MITKYGNCALHGNFFTLSGNLMCSFFAGFVTDRRRVVSERDRDRPAHYDKPNQLKFV